MGDTPGQIHFRECPSAGRRYDRRRRPGVFHRAGMDRRRAHPRPRRAARGHRTRALDMMIEYSKVRTTFGQPLANRQAIQFMIADSAMELHACRLMVYECAWRHDRGEDIRQLSYMTKIMCAEMAEPRRRPLDSGPRRFGIDARIAAGVVVPPGPQHPHHRRHAGSSALAVGAAYHSESQGMRSESGMVEDRDRGWKMAILDPPSSIFDLIHVAAKSSIELAND